VLARQLVEGLSRPQASDNVVCLLLFGDDYARHQALMV
jgi:hypothetical protein